MNHPLSTLTETAPSTPQRHNDIDFLKFVLILLVVTFHLAYIGDTHPWAKRLVYTFHMPAFLLISGYFTSLQKPVRSFFRGLLWLIVPYLIMESGYIVMASLLPIREHIDHLTPQVFLTRLLAQPLGPYWYLHTLVLCKTVLYLVAKLPRLSVVGQLMLTSICFYAIAATTPLLSLSCALYFLAGAALRMSQVSLTAFFRSTWLSLPAFILLALHEGNLDKATTGGIFIVYCAMSIILLAYRHTPTRLLPLPLFIGRNTLPIYLFSPIFTILCKQILPYLMFDPSGTAYLLVALPLCVAGSLAITWLMELTGASVLMFGHRKVMR
jgi:fucose 4-O-acetylase-like acetyltransferase